MDWLIDWLSHNQTLWVSCLVMFCVEDHNGIKSWTLLWFYSIVFDVFSCVSGICLMQLNKSKSKGNCFIKKNKRCTEKHTEPWLKNRGTYRTVTFVYRYTPSTCTKNERACAQSTRVWVIHIRSALDNTT